MKKIKEFFLRNVFVRPKAIIFLTIVAIGVLTVALLLTGCCLPNAGAGRQKFFRNVGPVWSPDGSKIAFVSAGSEEKFDIWVMNTDGSNQINLTNK